MAMSEVEIANSALVKIGAERISSFEENSKRARVVSAQYPLSRDALLRMYRWNFAIERVTLAPEATGPAFGFTNRFLLPHDALHFLGIYDEDEPQTNYTSTRIPHKVEGRYVLSDETSLPVFYIKQVTDVIQFDPLFSEALALWLALDVFFDLTTGTGLQNKLEKTFNTVIRKAQLADAIEGQPEIIIASEWLDSRDDDFPHRIGPALYR